MSKLTSRSLAYTNTVYTNVLFQPLYTIPPERTFNNGNVSLIDQWLFETIRLPPLASGSKMVLQGLFDLKFGAYGLDNVFVHTEQK